jgi:predicted dehydrogenase
MDIVAIGSPSGLHARAGDRGRGARLHVLVEKPLDITTADRRAVDESRIAPA